MEIRVNPTRMELNRLKGRLTMAQRGHKLLKDKRDELMRKFLELIRENKDLMMSVRVPRFIQQHQEDESGDVYPYGFATTSAELDTSISALAGVLPQMIKLAEVEKAVSLLANEIDKTRRRVNALEHVIIPQLIDTIKYISMKLDENERSSLVRLMKIKDIVRGEAAGKTP